MEKALGGRDEPRAMSVTYLEIRICPVAQCLRFRTRGVGGLPQRAERVVHARAGRRGLGRRSSAKLLGLWCTCSICCGYLRARPMRRRDVPGGRGERIVLLLILLSEEERHGGGLAPREVLCGLPAPVKDAFGRQSIDAEGERAGAGHSGCAETKVPGAGEYCGWSTMRRGVSQTLRRALTGVRMSQQRRGRRERRRKCKKYGRREAAGCSRRRVVRRGDF